MTIEANFEAHLSEGGKVVPGSVRTGHNVFTNYGRLWLRDLVAWNFIEQTIPPPPPPPIPPPPPVGADVYKDNRRVRWMSVGEGSLLETPAVQRLQTPHLVDQVNYLVAIQSASYFLPTAVRFTQVFGTALFAGLPSPVTISEAGLFVDEGTTLDTTSPTNIPVFYKTLDPLTVTVGVQTLTIRWELRF